MTHAGTSYSEYMIHTPLWRDKVETLIIFVEVFMPSGFVVSWRVVFGKIIRFVDSAWSPVNEEVSLAWLILDPI